MAKKIAAEEAAHRMSGVLDVANDITVVLPGEVAHGDSELAAAVRQVAVEASQVTPDDLRDAIHDALERHADREASRIQIDVEGGRVTGTRGVENVIDRTRIA